MAVTLNFQHTFSTRVVYSSAEIKEMRLLLALAIEAAHLQENSNDPKKAAHARAGIAFMTRVVEMSDEDLVSALIRESFKQGVAEELRKDLKDLNVTRMGPIQTVKVSK
ncbi:hypothetical protein GWQ44_16110 [Pseudomonas sp. 3MA1]|uniref:hypothetical protein n=1 Tax=Pseudomonas sp. 3MA1 TaxID=2699196 RepID=UPI0023DD6BF1|nr:hypothetical protein [Pseudomonas sp. 3MA1]MDF2397071.1 hypothetical protein [Pseudomonas sp. 3MA1]